MFELENGQKQEEKTIYEQKMKLVCIVNSYLKIPIMFYIWTSEQLCTLKFKKM